MKSFKDARLESIEHRLRQLETVQNNKIDEPRDPETRDFEKMLENLGIAFLYFATATFILKNPDSDKYDGALRTLLDTKEEFNAEKRRKAVDNLGECMSKFIEKAISA